MRHRTKILLTILFTIFVYCSSCSLGDIYNAKEFLFNNPDITFQIDGGEWFNKYTPPSKLTGNFVNSIMKIKINNIEYEVLLRNTWSSFFQANKFSALILFRYNIYKYSISYSLE